MCARGTAALPSVKVSTSSHRCTRLDAAPQYVPVARSTASAAPSASTIASTDSAAALRAIEVGAELLLKATKVDGVYSADPRKDSTAQRFERLTYDQVIERKLAVMDTAAIALCRDYKIPLRIYDINGEGMLMRIMKGEPLGTLVDSGR